VVAAFLAVTFAMCAPPAFAQIEECVGRYLQQLDTADRQEPSEV